MYVHPASLQKVFKTAVGKAGITKNAAVHTYSKTQLRSVFVHTQPFFYARHSRQVSVYIQGSVEHPEDIYAIVALDQIGDTIVTVEKYMDIPFRF
jgi:DNA transposition AAA+ family ATPase